MFNKLKEFTKGEVGTGLRLLATWPKFFLSATPNPNILYNVFGDYGGMTINGERPMFNMGYWTEADPSCLEDIEIANYALFDLVCHKADISAADELVVDAGCGYGTNAIHCVSTYQPQKVVGLNLSSVQREKGHELIAQAGFADRIKIIADSATDMRFSNNSVDKILSIEAAVHFNTRQDFFKEAYRVLRPGGILSVADLAFTPPKNTQEGLLAAYISRVGQMPKANIYDANEYLNKLQQTGFEIVEHQSIYQQIFPPFQRWFYTQYVSPYSPFKLVYAASFMNFFIYPWDYIHVKARKPEEHV